MFNQVCVADIVESLFETRIGKIFWPIYVAITIVIPIFLVCFYTAGASMLFLFDHLKRAGKAAVS